MHRKEILFRNLGSVNVPVQELGSHMKSEVKTQSTCTTKEVVFDFAGRPVLGIECSEHHAGFSEWTPQSWLPD